MKRISCSAVLVIIYTVLYGIPRRPEKRIEFYIGTYTDENGKKLFKTISLLFRHVFE